MLQKPHVDVKEYVIEFFRQYLERTGRPGIDVNPSSWIADDLGIGDDPEYTVVIYGLKDELGIEIPDRDAENFSTVGDVINYVQRRMKI